METDREFDEAIEGMDQLPGLTQLPIHPEDNDYRNIRGLDLRQLRQFVVLADELHFGRAAKRLGIAQPPLSQTIKRLETEIGAELFGRSKRRVELTAAGKAFLVEVTGALQQIDFALRVARRVAAGDFATLRVGFISAALFRALPKAMRTFRELSPSVVLDLIEAPSQRQIESLRNGTLDIGFICPIPHLLEGLTSICVERARPIAAIPESWPLASRDSIMLADLAGMPFILLPYRDHPAHYMGVMSACQSAGFTPNVVQEAAQSQTMLSLAAAGLGVALVAESAADTGMGGVRFVPVSDLPDALSIELAAVWNPNFESPTRDKLLAVL
ncbi:MAG: LysR substrate-binding domain-containing protein [Sphingobium sp.]